MTSDAQHVVADVLLITEERLIGNNGPFHIISSMLWAYFREWGWVSRG